MYYFFKVTLMCDIICSISKINLFREKLYVLISKFEKDKNHYLSKGYLEAQVRSDFINPFFKALG